MDPGRQVHREAQDAEQTTRKLTAMREEARRLMHRPLAEPHRWYASVLQGHYGYYGVPQNWRSLKGFLQEVRRLWFDCLRRRSQRNRRMGWDWFEAVIARFPLPAPRITHPWTSGAA